MDSSQYVKWPAAYKRYLTVDYCYIKTIKDDYTLTMMTIVKKEKEEIKKQKITSLARK